MASLRLQVEVHGMSLASNFLRFIHVCILNERLASDTGTPRTVTASLAMTSDTLKSVRRTQRWGACLSNDENAYSGRGSINRGGGGGRASTVQLELQKQNN